MQTQKSATLQTILSDVLADLAFMFSDDDMADTPEGEIWLETAIEYVGPKRGSLVFLCPQSFTAALASNLLNVQPEDEGFDDMCVDAVKEFMNIVCGQFITAVHGVDEVFDLTIPVVKELPETPILESDSDERHVIFSIEGHPVQLSCADG